MRLGGRLRLSRLFRRLLRARLPLRRLISRWQLHLRLLRRHSFRRLLLLLLRRALRLPLSRLLLLAARATALPSLGEGLLLRPLPGLRLRIELGRLLLSQLPLGLLGRRPDRLLRPLLFRPLGLRRLSLFSPLSSQPSRPLAGLFSSSPLFLPLLSDAHFCRWHLRWCWRLSCHWRWRWRRCWAWRCVWRRQWRGPWRQILLQRVRQRVLHQFAGVVYSLRAHELLLALDDRLLAREQGAQQLGRARLRQRGTLRKQRRGREHGREQGRSASWSARSGWWKTHSLAYSRAPSRRALGWLGHRWAAPQRVINEAARAGTHPIVHNQEVKKCN